MAVPFSKPCYTGISGSGSNRRRPRGRQSQQQQQQPQHHQQQLQPSQQQQQSQLQRNNEHPITRFLYGDGQIQLDRLSLTSRIAFYALYEAWRLLQDLTQSTGNDNGRASPRRSTPRSAPEMETPVRSPASHQFEFIRPDVIPRGDDVSTQSIYTCRVEPSPSSSSCSTPCQSPVKSSPSSSQVKRQRLMSESSDDEFPAHEFTSSLRRRRDHHDRHIASQNYPDMIPLDEEWKMETGSISFIRPSSQFPDLISSPLHLHHNQHQSPDDTDEEEEVDKGFDDVDGHDDSRVLSNVGGVDWYKLGAQLSTIATAFESTFYKPATEEQKAVYEAFQRIKMSSSLFIDGENSMSGFAKLVCRQVLLSSIWILLKKVL